MVENFASTLGTKLQIHQDMYVYASYICGMRVSDMLLLKWSDFDGTNLNATIHKTESKFQSRCQIKG